MVFAMPPSRGNVNEHESIAAHSRRLHIIRPFRERNSQYIPVGYGTQNAYSIRTARCYERSVGLELEALEKLSTCPGDAPGPISERSRSQPTGREEPKLDEATEA